MTNYNALNLCNSFYLSYYYVLKRETNELQTNVTIIV